MVVYVKKLAIKNSERIYLLKIIYEEVFLKKLKNFLIYNLDYLKMV